MPTEEEGCVQNILSKKLSPGETATKQDIAIAFSECSEKKASNALGVIKIKIASMKLEKISIPFF